MDVVDGTESAVPTEFTVTRPSSPTPTADFSIIDETEWTYYPYIYSNSSSSLRSIIPRIWDSFSHSSDSLNTPRIVRPSVPHSIRQAARAGYGSLRGKRKANAPVLLQRPTSACSSYFEVEWSDCTVDYSTMAPLDGEEGELIDDEGCYVDLRAVTGLGTLCQPCSTIKLTHILFFTRPCLDILALLPQELALHILTVLATGTFSQDAGSSAGGSVSSDSASSLHAILACTLVSRTWYALAHDNAVWRSLFEGMRRARGWAIDLSRARAPPLKPPPSPFVTHPISASVDSVFDYGSYARGRMKSLPPLPNDHDGFNIWHMRSISAPTLTTGISVAHTRHRQRPQSTGAAASPLIMDWFKLFRDRWELDLRWAGKASRTKGNSLSTSITANSPSETPEEGEPKTMHIGGHTDSVYCLEFDANRIVTGSRDRTIKVWCVHTGRLLGTIRGHAGSVLCLKFDFGVPSPHSIPSSGRANFLKQSPVWRSGFMVSGSSDCSVAVWDLFVRRMPGEEEAGASDDGESAFEVDAASMIANVGDDDRDHGDAARAELRTVLRGHTGGVLDLRIDDRWIVSW
ncbi:hypothetical protein HGRIS_012437 [Hohenbuehelia grisea]|uniref:F-box domain-containing protein n=1 Tax=Hohenbuehelia grisea TaxID=104357 RepID=A0ABR3IS85_9AGAR